MAERHKIIPASYLILKKDNKILLLRRYGTGYRDGEYSLISGHVEKDESFSDTIVREAEEEANIIIRKEDLKVLHVNNRPAENYLDVYFTVDDWKGEIMNREPDRCDDLSWYDVDDLPKNILPNVMYVLSELSSRFYSEYR